MTRNIQIDFLRFIAIVLVVFRHSIPLPEVSLLLRGYSLLRTGGWIGVDLFFVLSGYLITTLIISEYRKTGRFNIKKFIIRRGLKIYPLYYLFLISSYLFQTYILKNPQSSWNFFFEAVFIGNYYGLNNEHLWSICIEEHFYIFISVVFLLIVKRLITPKSLVLMYVCFAVIGLSIRFYNYLEFPVFNVYRDYMYTHIRIDGLLFGSVLAYLSAYKPNFLLTFFNKKGRSVFLISLSLVAIAANFVFELHQYQLVSVISLLLNPIAFGLILMHMLRLANQQLLYLMWPFAKIGQYSYSIYLFHLMCLEMPIPVATNYGLLPFVLRMALVFIGGIVMSKTIEYPIIKLRDKYFPSNYKLLKLGRIRSKQLN